MYRVKNYRYHFKHTCNDDNDTGYWKLQKLAYRIFTCKFPVIAMSWSTDLPKFTKLTTHAQERLQFAMLFSVRWYIASFYRYLWSSLEVVWNFPLNFDVFFRQTFLGDGAQISGSVLQIWVTIEYVKFWWQLTEQPGRLEAEKERNQHHENSAAIIRELKGRHSHLWIW